MFLSDWAPCSSGKNVSPLEKSKGTQVQVEMEKEKDETASETQEEDEEVGLPISRITAVA